MIEFWKTLSVHTRFSIIAFLATGALGIFSMGLLGAGLYYPVSFLLRKYPSINDWSGDWVWPATIAVGMFWSFGFLFSGITYHFLAKISAPKPVLYSTYIFILWAWAAVMWYLVLKNNITSG